MRALGPIPRRRRACVAAPSAKPRPLSPISARTWVSSIATKRRMRASARREPYLTAFVKSSLTSSRTAKRRSRVAVQSLEPIDEPARLADRLLACRQVQLQLSPVESGGHSRRLTPRRRICTGVESAACRRASGGWPRTRFASGLSTSASGTAAAPGRGARECSSLVCECGDEDCTAPITLMPAEYESVRADETQFASSPATSAPRWRTSCRSRAAGSSCASAARPGRSRPRAIPAS